MCPKFIMTSSDINSSNKIRKMLLQKGQIVENIYGAFRRPTRKACYEKAQNSTP